MAMEIHPFVDAFVYCIFCLLEGGIINHLELWKARVSTDKITIIYFAEWSCYSWPKLVQWNDILVGFVIRNQVWYMMRDFLPLKKKDSVHPPKKNSYTYFLFRPVKTWCSDEKTLRSDLSGFNGFGDRSPLSVPSPVRRKPLQLFL